MKKVIVFLLAGAILAGCVGVYASGGTAADPLVSLSYLNSTFLPSMEQQMVSRIDSKVQGAYQSALDSLNASHSGYLAQIGGSVGEAETETSALTGQRFKRGDVVTLSTGTTVMLMAGSASVSYAMGGAAVDMTAGQELPSGGSLPAFHRVLAGENTTAAVTITSDTAVLAVEGHGALSTSGNVDYNALADALYRVGLFQGTGTAYGSGYDLEVVPTRIVGLVMFLRLQGKEADALAYSGANPFVDTPAWCDRYVAYAYAMGLTRGVGTDADGRLCFNPNAAISAGEYMTFLLRALGYTDSGSLAEFSWQTALSFAQNMGVINSAEYSMLTSGSFLRAQVVYLSFFSLSVPLKDGSGTLLDKIVASGGADALSLYTVVDSVTVPRLS